MVDYKDSAFSQDLDLKLRKDEKMKRRYSHALIDNLILVPQHFFNVSQEEVWKSYVTLDPSRSVQYVRKCSSHMMNTMNS